MSDTVIPDEKVENLEITRKAGRTVRIITGSYEHNLLCVALTLTKKSEIFTPIFHFTPHTQSIRCLAASKRYLVSGANDELIRIYDLQKRRELGTLMQHSGQILCLKFFQAKWLFSGGGDGKILLWRTKDWELLSELKGHKGPVVDIAIHPSGKIALSVGEDRKLFLWNLMTGRKASKQPLRDTPRKVEWVPNTNSYVVGFDRKLVGYTSTKPDFEVPLSSPLYHMEFCTYQDTTYLIVSLGNGKILFYDFKAVAEDGATEPAFTLEGHSTRVKDFCLLEDLLVSVSSDGRIVVWDLASRDQVAVYSCGDRLNCVTMVPDEVEKYVKQPEEVQSEVETDEEASQRRKKRKRGKVVVTQE